MTARPAPHAPIVVLTDLDHAWANVYVGEPLVPQLKIGQAATLVDAFGIPDEVLAAPIAMADRAAVTS